MNKEKNVGLYVVANIILLGLITYASTSLTVSFFGSIGTGEVQRSNLILGLVNDICKIFLPMCIGISLFKKKYLHATVLILITIGTLFISYMASQGLDLNISNGYLLKSSNKNEIVGMKNEIVSKKVSLENEKNSRVQELTKTKDSLPSNYITKRKEMQSQIDAVIQEYNAKIDSTDKNINSYNDKILNYKVDDSLTTDGYHALAKSLGTTVDKITKYKNIFLEVLAIILSLNLGVLLGESNISMASIFRKKETKTEAKDEPKVEEDPTNVDSIVKKKSISLDKVYVDDEITDIDIQKYLKVARKTSSESGRCIGYKKIGELAGVKSSYKIYKYLKEKGIIVIKNNNAYIENSYIEKGA